jgi:hypothetical protein
VSEFVRSGDERPGDAAAAGGDELRGAARFALLIRPAKLVCGRFEYPCVMRDVSETGVSIRLFHPIGEHERWAIEMLSGDCYDIEPVWLEGLAAGFRFVQPVDLDQILANAGPYPNRPVRLNMEVPAILEHGARKSHITLNNISQQGARLTSSDYLALGQLVVLQSDCLPRIHAKVRWRKGEEYGVVFEETFKLAELSALAVRIHSSFAFLRGDGSQQTKSSAA